MEQRLIQSPQMIQAMQILQLPLLELSERIDQELLENPFLERVENDGSDGADGGGDADGPREAPETAKERDAEAILELFERLEGGEHGDGSRQGSGSAAGAAGDDGDRKYEALMNTPEDAVSLHQAILQQLSGLELTDREWRVLEYVVWSLDERGYLTETPSTLAAELTLEEQRMVAESAGQRPVAAILDEEDPAPEPEPSGAVLDPEEELGPEDLVVTEDEVRDALERLREEVHPGLGALDLAECLLLQLPSAGLWNPLMRQLIGKHLGDVRANRLPQIAKATGEDIEDIKAAIDLLRTLNPSPGASFGETAAEVIHPEVKVDLVDGEVVCKLDRERAPRLRISPTYQTKTFAKMLKEGSKEERDWAKKRLENAQWFLDAVIQRESTLTRIANALFNRQKAFLERGKEALRPLRMQEIADEVGVHISTVSRAVAGKFAQTPRGIFPLKFFFVGGTTKASGEEASQVTIKERIKKIVEAEDKKKPLSDEAIGKALEEEDGIKIARRTVTKYRKALEIPSSTQRRSY